MLLFSILAGQTTNLPNSEQMSFFARFSVLDRSRNIYGLCYVKGLYWRCSIITTDSEKTSIMWAGSVTTPFHGYDGPGSIPYVHRICYHSMV